MFAYGFNALIMGLFFQEMGYTDDLMGIFFTMTLLGDVLLSLLLTLIADSLGRRNVLFAGSGLMVVSGAAFALNENYWVLLLAAVVGVISPSGNEIGPFRAVEESTLSHLTVMEMRAEVFTWYIVLASVGTSGGVLFCGYLVDELEGRGWTAREAYHMLFWIYAGCGVVNMGLTLCLSGKCEVDGFEEGNGGKQEYQSLPQSEATSSPRTHTRTPSSTPLLQNGHATSTPEPPSASSQPTTKPSSGLLSKFTSISPSTRPTLYKLLSIISLDSLASGMSSSSLLSLYLTRKFSIQATTLSTLLSLTFFLSASTNIFAGAIAKRIGLIKTMVFTHLPSAIFLALLPVPRSLWGTATLMVLRSCLSSLDQAPRSAFIAAVVGAGERTAVMGIVNVGKILGQSGGPSVTGLLARHGVFWVAFVLAGSFKVCYDVGLLTLFVGTKLHKHEEGGGVVETARDEEDLAELLEDSDSEADDSEGERALGKEVEAAARLSGLRKSFSFPSSKSKERKESEDDVGADVASPIGHRRTGSFLSKGVK